MRFPQLTDALKQAAHNLGAQNDFDVQLERPRETTHGDLASNLAMILAGRLRQKPRDLAQAVIDELDLPALRIDRADIAGPGFINFTLSRDYLREQLREAVRKGEAYGRGVWGEGLKVNLEFVSANPTGPLHVGHGRGASVGDTVARLLEFTGHNVHREFYVNDAGVQIDKLVDSIESRFRGLQGQETAIPDGGYHGDYVIELAEEVQAEFGDRLNGEWGPEERMLVREYAVRRVESEQRNTMQLLRVEFDEFRSESALYESKQIGATLDDLAERGLIYPREGAAWFRTSTYGDDKDRVLVKSDGTYTYFLPDIAYHREKALRGFGKAIDVWGADHHGYVPRMTAAMESLGLGRDFFEAVIVQLVRVERGGEELKFSKRSGDYVTLRDLTEEVGADVARYFFLERGPQQQMVFDLDLAKERSDKNPVYKVQYAHARICSVFRRGEIDPTAIDLDADLTPVTQPAAFEMIKTILDFPEIVEGAARHREPHRMTAYVEELANHLNSWYHAGTRDPELRVLGVEEHVTKARLVLIRAAEIVLRNGLALLGIDAPEQM